jgi:hypothetical protein
MWDYKPKMREMFGKDLPENVRDGQRITGMTSKQKTLPVCPLEVRVQEVRQQRPGGVGQRACFPTPPRSPTSCASCTRPSPRRSTTTRRSPTSRPAARSPGRPSLGSWLSYGLGRMNDNLPGYVLMHAHTSFAAEPVQPPVGQRLPRRPPPGRAAAQPGRPVLYLSNPDGVSAATAARCSTPWPHSTSAARAFGDPEIARIAARDGLPHADLGARADGPLQAKATRRPSNSTAKTRKNPGTFAANAACCPAPRRARRAQHPDLPPRLGRPRQPAQGARGRSAPTPTRPARP